MNPQNPFRTIYVKCVDWLAKVGGLQRMYDEGYRQGYYDAAQAIRDISEEIRRGMSKPKTRTKENKGEQRRTEENKA